MSDFLTYLAERKANLYKFLYVSNPQAFTSHECFERIEAKSKYEEVIGIISFLPEEQRKKVNDRYKEFMA